MEYWKLIELLNKHCKENRRPADFEEYFDRHFFWGKQEHWFKWSVDESVILSKNYGFIQRLVDNDKIDFDKAMKLWIPCFVQYDKWEIICVHDVDFYKQLLMLLSISDTPIEDLISYLKIS